MSPDMPQSILHTRKHARGQNNAEKHVGKQCEEACPQSILHTRKHTRGNSAGKAVSEQREVKRGRQSTPTDRRWEIVPITKGISEEQPQKQQRREAEQLVLIAESRKEAKAIPHENNTTTTTTLGNNRNRRALEASNSTRHFVDLCELVLHRHELRAELLLVKIVESGDLLQADGGVELQVGSDLREQDLLLHLLHKELRLFHERTSFGTENHERPREKKNTQKE